MTTTIRLDPKLKRAVMKGAKELGMKFSELTKLLFMSFVERGRSIEETRYPKSYLTMLERESKETRRLYKEGRLKGYSSGIEMIRDILGK